MVHSASVDSTFFTPGWDASPSQGYLPPSFSRPAVSISTPPWKTDTMRVHCLAQEHDEPRQGSNLNCLIWNLLCSEGLFTMGYIQL